MATKVIKFSASWCGPCKQVAPLFDEFKKKYSPKVECVSVDIDKNTELTEKYKIRAIPTLILEHNDEVIVRSSGINCVSEIEKIIDNYLPQTKPEMLYNTLEEALTDLGWYHISQLNTENKTGVDHINSIIGYNPETKEPTVKTENKTIIVCDNHDFNETYLIDLVSKELKKRDTKPGDYELIYVDNICIREYLDNPKYINYRTGASVDELKLVEKEKLVCKVFVINPEAQCITAIEESVIAPINENQVSYILNYLDTEFAKKEMAK